MESVVTQSYYSYCGGLVFASPTANQQEAFLRQQAIDIYNLRPREGLSTKDETNSSLLQPVKPPAKRATRGKPINRSRTTYSKRLLVNARERERMKTLNKGFQNLRNALPCYIADGHISKITTLRLAINYIKTLTDVLNNTNEHREDEHNPFSDADIFQHLNNAQLLNVFHNVDNPVKREEISQVGEQKSAFPEFDQAQVPSSDLLVASSCKGSTD